jgi:hypothetical protein
MYSNYHESPTDVEFERFCITNLGEVARLVDLLIKYVRYGDRDRAKVEMLRIKDMEQIELSRDK